MKRKRSIARKILPGLIILIPVLLFIAFLRIPAYINNHLSNFVAEKSGNLYSLKFDEISFNNKVLSFSIRGVDLAPDPEMARTENEKNPSRIFYSFTSPEIQVNNISIIKFLRNKSISCNELKIIEPHFDLSGGQSLRNDSVPTFRYLFRELQPLFGKRLKSISVKEINLDNAKYELYRFFKDTTRISQAEKISIAIRNFRTDSLLAARPSIPFESDDIELQMMNFRAIMGDSLHQALINSVIYSFRNSEINTSGFHLLPINRSGKHSYYNISVPGFRLRSKSITSFNFTDSLTVDTLELLNPEIGYFQKTDPKKLSIEDINRVNLFTLVKNNFKRIEIEHFNLIDARLKIFSQPDTNNYQQQFERINIHLTDFKLDSLSGLDPERLFHAKEMDMKLKGYHFRMNDNFHEFRADSLFASTKSNRLGAKKIKVSPVRNYNPLHAELKIRCDEISLSDINLKILYHTRKMPASSIRVIKPDAGIIYHQDKEKNRSGRSFLVFDLVSDILLGVYADQVNIEKGLLHIEYQKQKEKTGYLETGFQFRLKDFQLDSVSINNPERFFFAKGFNLLFNDFGMKLVDNLHQLKVSRLDFSDIGNFVTIDSLRLMPVTEKVDEGLMRQFNKSEAFNIMVPGITLSKTNLHKAWFSDTLSIDHFKVDQPQIKFESFGALKKKKTNADEFLQLILSYLNDIQINRLEVSDGKITLINHSKKSRTISLDNTFSALLTNFRLNESEVQQDKLLFADEFDLSFTDQLFTLSDSVHNLKTGKISFTSRESAIKVENAVLYPDNQSKKYGSLNKTFQVTLPEIELTGTDLYRLLRRKEVDVKKIRLVSPQLEIFSKKNITKKTNFKDYVLPFPAGINWMKINSLDIDNGKVTTYQLKPDKTETTSTFNLQFKADNLTFTDKPDLSTANVSALVSDFRVNLDQNRYKLDIKELIYNKTGKSISVSGVRFSPNHDSDDRKMFEINVPLVEFSGFNTDQAITKDEYYFDNIFVNRPAIFLNRENKSGDDNKPMINKLIEPYANWFKVGNLILKNAGLRLEGGKHPLRLDRFNLNLKGIDITPGIQNENFLNSEEIEFNTGKLEKTSKDGFYRISADSVYYNSVRQKLILSSIGIKSTYGRQKFETLKKFQSDYINASISNITLHNPDIKNWFTNNTIKAGALRIGNAGLEITRNKKLPFNEAQRPPFPLQLLEKIEAPFKFDSVILEASDIRYNEILPDSDIPGYIDFNEVRFKSGIFTNIKPLPDEFKISASSRLMNSAKLKADFTFETNTPDFRHLVSGSLDSMQINSFNPMIEKAGHLSIVSGNLTRCDFELDNNNYNSTGNLWFGFDNLKVSVLEPDEEGFRKAKFASFLANTLVLPSKNPKDKTLEPIPINHVRDEKRSVLNFWWKALFSGVKDVLGIKDKEEKNKKDKN